MPDPVESLQELLEQHVQYILSTARESSPAGSSQWNALLRGYHLIPPAAEARGARAAQLQLQQGALPEEVRSALYVVSLMFQNHLRRLDIRTGITAGDCGDGEARLLKARLLKLAHEEGLKYDESVRPGQSGQLGGIFANVKRTAAMDPWAHLKWEDRNVTLRCAECGAPQQAALDFICAFCDKNIFGEPRTAET